MKKKRKFIDNEMKKEKKKKEKKRKERKKKRKESLSLTERKIFPSADSAFINN